MNNLILDLFNVSSDDIYYIHTFNDENETVNVIIRLKKKEMYCPRCGNKMVGNGIIKKPIKHKVLIDRNMKLLYEANRYRCKACGYSQIEKNPFALPGFSTSILVANQIMRDLHDPRYNYTMIAQKNGVSTQEVINYLDSYVVIPHIPSPTNLGIDEFHSKMAKRKDASYLGVLTDNDRFELVELLSSRNKADLNNFFSFVPKEEKEAVKYVTIDMWLPYKEMALK